MDIDIGNLVYIAFVAIIIIVNLFTKKKKQPPGQGPQNQGRDTVGPAPVDSRKSFEELLEEFTSPQKTAPAPAPVPVPVPKPKPVPHATKRIEAENKRKVQQQAEKRRHTKMKTEFGKFDEFKKTKSTSSQYAKAFRSRESARQAFVFSEIFDKKF